MNSYFCWLTQPGCRHCQACAWKRAGAWYFLIFALSCVPNFDLSSADWESWAGIFQFATRKTAHVLEYFALTILLWQALRYKKDRPLLWAFFAALILAALDEVHQQFVFGRVGQAMDVFIDATGIVAALVLYDRIESQARSAVSLK